MKYILEGDPVPWKVRLSSESIFVFYIKGKEEGGEFISLVTDVGPSRCVSEGALMRGVLNMGKLALLSRETAVNETVWGHIK